MNVSLRFKEEVAKALENFEEKEDVHIKEVNRAYLHGLMRQPCSFRDILGDAYIHYICAVVFQQAAVIRAQEQHRFDVLHSVIEVCFSRIQQQYPHHKGVLYSYS